MALCRTVRTPKVLQCNVLALQGQLAVQLSGDGPTWVFTILCASLTPTAASASAARLFDTKLAAPIIPVSSVSTSFVSSAGTPAAAAGA